MMELIAEILLRYFCFSKLQTTNTQPLNKFITFAKKGTMCKYSDIENIELQNGKTVKEVNEEVRREIERIYAESWLKGFSVPFFGDDGSIYLANPDGSEDKVILDRNTRTYNIIMRTAQPGCGRFAYIKL